MVVCIQICPECRETIRPERRCKAADTNEPKDLQNDTMKKFTTADLVAGMFVDQKPENETETTRFSIYYGKKESVWFL